MGSCNEKDRNQEICYTVPVVNVKFKEQGGDDYENITIEADYTITGHKLKETIAKKFDFDLKKNCALVLKFNDQDIAGDGEKPKPLKNFGATDNSSEIICIYSNKYEGGGGGEGISESKK